MSAHSNSTQPVPATTRGRMLAGIATGIVLFQPAFGAQGDTWVGPWDWTCQIDPVQTVDGNEISHAALIPYGPYRGMVLMWRAPRNVPPDPPQTESWIFNPAAPTVLLKVEQDLESDIFCSAMSWDRDGQLVVAGGAPGGVSAPTEAYRYFPSLLRHPPKYELPFDPCNPALVVGAPWRDAGDMSIGRYYPTLITLLRGDIVGTPTIAGGSSFVLGGLAVLGGQLAFGNDYWQLLESGSVVWTRTLHSPNETFNAPP